MYVNTYIEEQHNYENYENFRAQERLQNPYEDEVATVHSEGVASQAPMVPPRDGDEWVQARMGDIRYKSSLSENTANVPQACSSHNQICLLGFV